MKLWRTIFITPLLDGIWILLRRGGRFRIMFDKIPRNEIPAAINAVLFVYFFIILFIFTFVPKLETYWETFLFGSLMFGTYESSSLILFNRWNRELVLQDSLWGGTLMCIMRYFD